MLSFLLKLRTRAQTLFRLSDAHTMLVWSVIVGIGGALATVAFREGIELIQRAISGTSGSFTEMAKRLPWQVRFWLPAAGGFLAGCVLLVAQRGARKESKTDYMEAVALGDGVVPVRQSLWRSASSLLTIGSGGSIGREGPMVQLAALAASLVGRCAHFDPPRLRLLVACGAAAGITSAYNAPIAGAFFVCEIVLGSIAMESFGPVVVASVVANIVMREFAGYKPPYQMPVFPAVAGWEVLFFVALGLLCGAAAPPFRRRAGPGTARVKRRPAARGRGAETCRGGWRRSPAASDTARPHAGINADSMRNRRHPRARRSAANNAPIRRLCACRPRVARNRRGPRARFAVAVSASFARCRGIGHAPRAPCAVCPLRVLFFRRAPAVRFALLCVHMRTAAAQAHRPSPARSPVAKRPRHAATRTRHA